VSLSKQFDLVTWSSWDVRQPLSFAATAGTTTLFGPNIVFHRRIFPGTLRPVVNGAVSPPRRSLPKFFPARGHISGDGIGRASPKDFFKCSRLSRPLLFR
jgi:hypothetical protein